ncbi:MAG: molecular chaperone TorD family protein [Haloferacaceae archaeon]
MTTSSDAAPGDPDPDLDADAAARGALYALLASALTHPDETLHRELASGGFADRVASYCDRTPVELPTDALVTDDDYDTLCARYNDVFVVGFSEYVDPTDGTKRETEPPVPLYETAYRPNASWNDVNLDLARAYDYYDVEVNQEDRDNHDHLRLELEFAGYLARREAAVDGGDAAAARLDFHDRHLRVLVEGVAERIDDEPGVGVYGDVVAALDAFTAADRADLAARIEG